MPFVIRLDGTIAADTLEEALAVRAALLAGASAAAPAPEPTRAPPPERSAAAPPPPARDNIAADAVPPLRCGPEPIAKAKGARRWGTALTDEFKRLLPWVNTLHPDYRPIATARAAGKLPSEIAYEMGLPEKKVANVLFRARIQLAKARDMGAPDRAEATPASPAADDEDPDGAHASTDSPAPAVIGGTVGDGATTGETDPAPGRGDLLDDQGGGAAARAGAAPVGRSDSFEVWTPQGPPEPPPAEYLPNKNGVNTNGATPRALVPNPAHRRYRPHANLMVRLEALRPWVGVLSERHRQVFEARVSGEQPADTAIRLGMSPLTVSDTIYQARRRLEDARDRGAPAPSTDASAAPPRAFAEDRHGPQIADRAGPQASPHKVRHLYGAPIDGSLGLATCGAEGEEIKIVGKLSMVTCPDCLKLARKCGRCGGYGHFAKSCPLVGSAGVKRLREYRAEQDAKLEAVRNQPLEVTLTPPDASESTAVDVSGECFSRGPDIEGPAATTDDRPTEALARVRRKQRVLNGGRVRAKTLPLPAYRDQLPRAEFDLTPDTGDHALPATRADCEGGYRPCPLVRCKYNLYLDVNEATGSVKLNFPHLEPWEMRESCVLDIADRGGITLEEVGAMLNLTRERIRQVEVRGLSKIKDYSAGELGLPPERAA